MSKVTKIYDNTTGATWDIEPWPHVRFGARVSVMLTRVGVDADPVWPYRSGDVAVRYGQRWSSVEGARTWAQAILAACDLAERAAQEVQQ